MMKFELVLILSSALYGDCKEPQIYPKLFNSHYDCATSGYLNSITSLQTLGPEHVNKFKLQVAFHCNEVHES